MGDRPREHPLSLFAARFYAGTVRIDCRNVFDAAQPFGGYKRSGWGRENSGEICHSCAETKAITAAL
ncbi:MAG: aldehyde dehydrogenase family protein [Acetobacteraceae bacterium]|nr:aldehyde dehydrogenase family protein [Acetobacteraceae bacterium]